MRRPPPLPQELLSRAFTVREADEWGVSRSRLRRSDLVTPAYGVRVARSLPASADTPWAIARRDTLDRARIETVRLPPDAAISHVTAGVALGFPLSLTRMRDPLVHVTCRSDASRRRHHGVRVHPLPRDLRHVYAAGLRVTHPVDTWCALSAMLSLGELVAIGDHLVRRQRPDATIDGLQRAVDRYAGRHGAKKLRAAIALVRPRTDSAKETELRLLMTWAGLPEPVVNAPVRDHLGRHIKLGDLVYEEYRVLVEYDGDQHRTDTAQYEKDAADLERATASHWLVVRVRNRHLRDPASIAARVRSALRSRGWPDAGPFTDDVRRHEGGADGVSRP